MSFVLIEVVQLGIHDEVIAPQYGCVWSAWICLYNICIQLTNTYIFTVSYAEWSQEVTGYGTRSNTYNHWPACDHIKPLRRDAELQRGIYPHISLASYSWAWYTVRDMLLSVHALWYLCNLFVVKAHCVFWPRYWTSNRKYWYCDHTEPSGHVKSCC